MRKLDWASARRCAASGSPVLLLGSALIVSFKGSASRQQRMGGGLVRRRLLDWRRSSRDETSGLRAMAGLTKHPFLAIRMPVRCLIRAALCSVGLGEFTARIHGVAKSGQSRQRCSMPSDCRRILPRFRAYDDEDSTSRPSGRVWSCQYLADSKYNSRFALRDDIPERQRQKQRQSKAKDKCGGFSTASRDETGQLAGRDDASCGSVGWGYKSRRRSHVRFRSGQALLCLSGEQPHSFPGRGSSSAAVEESQLPLGCKRASDSDVDRDR